ncbi:flavodoxin [Candidatus Woesearchaeota archaeon]|nr:flavodoxin [Candidatus Woesearchaeota archaeon]
MTKKNKAKSSRSSGKSKKGSGSKKKALIVYFSASGNTKKVAEAIAEGLKSKLKVDVTPVSKASVKEIKDADIVGMGSGIYMWSAAKPLKKFVESLPVLQEKVAFTFSTSGFGRDMQLNSLKVKMNKKGLCVADSFSVKAYDTWGPLKLIGGINKGRPDKDDMKKATEFGEKIADMF